MILVPEKKIRKYVAFENGKWIHDPNMPEDLMAAFEAFVSKSSSETGGHVWDGMDNSK